MTIATYAELQAEIATALVRSDLTAEIPSYIRLCEADLNNRIRHWRRQTRVTGTLSSRFTALPADWQECIFLAHEDGARLRMVQREWMADRRSVNGGGKPYYYATTAGQIEAFPAPDDDYPYELLYVAKIPALSVSNTTNWVLDDFPDVYLYGALSQVPPTLDDTSNLDRWRALYEAGIAALNRSNGDMRSSRMVMRNG